MAMQKLFLEGETECFVPFGNLLPPMMLEYRFDGKTLQIRWNGKEKGFSAEIGDVFFIKGNWQCAETNTFPSVFRPAAPSNDKYALMWLCGFDTEARTCHRWIFEKQVRHLNRTFCWDGYYDKLIKKSGEYRFLLRTNPDINYTCHLEAWIADSLELTTEKIIEIMKAAKTANFLYYPDLFVRKLLAKRFGLKEEHFAEIGLDGQVKLATPKWWASNIQTTDGASTISRAPMTETIAATSCTPTIDTTSKIDGTSMASATPD